MAVATPPVQLTHEVHRGLGGGLVQRLQSPRTRFGSEEVGLGDTFGSEVVFEDGESANVAFS